MSLENVSFESKIKPGLRAVCRCEGRERKVLEILDICSGAQMSINLVLDGLRDGRSEVIADEISEIVS